MSEFCQSCLLCLLSLKSIFFCSLNSIRLYHLSKKERFPYFTFTYSAVHYSDPSSASEIDLFSLPFPETGFYADTTKTHCPCKDSTVPFYIFHVHYEKPVFQKKIVPNHQDYKVHAALFLLAHFT